MAIITISRQLGSMGEDIARKVSEKMHYRILDKQALSSALSKYGISEIERYDEKQPSVYATLLSSQYRYIHFLQSSIYRFAQQGNCIILGRGGQLLLGPLPGVLKVHIIAPARLRIERIRKQFECDYQTAEHKMLQADHERAGFYNYFFNINWQDPGLYDLTLNTDNIGLERSTGIIFETLKPFDALNIQKRTASMLADCCLGQEVLTTIFNKKNRAAGSLRATVKHGVVTLEGGVESRPDIEMCEHAAREVPGVHKVINRVRFINSWGGIA
jgi:cytidylate kinase